LKNRLTPSQTWRVTLWKFVTSKSHQLSGSAVEFDPHLWYLGICFNRSLSTH